MLARPEAPEPEDAAVAQQVELAPAKINLALHVVGQREDGYHLLESIVAFADIGDRLTFTASGEDGLTFSGQFAAALASDPGDNLVAHARDRLRSVIQRLGGEAPAVSIHLEKNLPVASGIGGGSADAAATLRGLLRFWRSQLSLGEVADLALSLGADVPMCLHGDAALVTGIGEQLSPLPGFPSLFLVLGNPLRAVSTPAVFSRLASKQNPPILGITGDDWISHLSRLRNDLEKPAHALVPEILEISDLISSQGAVLTRMSGSGATCFGIFPSREAADQAADRLTALKPSWYFRSTTTTAGFSA